MSGSGRRSAGTLESQLLAVVDRAAGPLTVQEILEAVEGGLAYTTVVTTLNRLCDKGALVRQAGAGRANRYSSTVPAEGLPALTTARRMNDLLSADGDRAGALAHFAAGLDPSDGELLARLLAEHSRESGS